MAGIALIIFSAFVSSRDDPIWDKEPKFYVAVGAPCLFGLVTAFAFGRAFPCISSPEAVAVTVETSYQNTGLALTIALATFSEDERGAAAGVPLYYGCVQVVLLPLFLLCAWKMGLTYAPKNARLDRVILGDWQPRVVGDSAVRIAPTGGHKGGTESAEAWPDPLVGKWVHSSGAFEIRPLGGGGDGNGSSGGANASTGGLQRLFCEGISPGTRGGSRALSGLLWPAAEGWHETEERPARGEEPCGLVRLRFDEERAAVVSQSRPLTSGTVTAAGASSSQGWSAEVLSQRQEGAVATTTTAWQWPVATGEGLVSPQGSPAGSNEKLEEKPCSKPCLADVLDPSGFPLLATQDSSTGSKAILEEKACSKPRLEETALGTPANKFQSFSSHDLEGALAAPAPAEVLSDAPSTMNSPRTDVGESGPMQMESFDDSTMDRLPAGPGASEKALEALEVPAAAAAPSDNKGSLELLVADKVDGGGGASTDRGPPLGQGQGASSPPPQQAPAAEASGRGEGADRQEELAAEEPEVKDEEAKANPLLKSLSSSNTLG
jgi:hypothetical protein